jgi:predicted pyridoxine 5'-phosphate oxidase superfamily flavin-nucleotide-binding protein
MSYGFLDVAVTPGVRAVQAQMGTDKVWANFRGHREFDRLGPDEVAFITDRDSLYIATVGESGWPYVQHRGGRSGFLKVLDEKTLAFPDYKGNLQYISVGNLTTDARAALILVDYPHRARMKILARVEIVGADERPDLSKQVVEPDYKAKLERLIILHLVTFDWNCPQHMTPRYTEAEINDAIKPLRDHAAALEAEVESLRQQLSLEKEKHDRSLGLRVQAAHGQMP